MPESNTYGAIDVPGGNDEFDEKNTYYLNESRFQWNRFLRAALPVVIALVIMGGFAYGMSHGFSHFYGPPKGTDNDDNIKQDKSWIPLDNRTPKLDGSTALCAKNDNCATFELKGNCCPTDEGVMLACCE